MWTVSKVLGLNTENKICLPNKECISSHNGAKCIVHMHITVELKVYWLTCLLIYTVMWSLCRLQ